MLPFEERLKLLHKALEKETPESLFEKLKSYGPCAEKIPEICWKTWPGHTTIVQRVIVSAANRITDKDTGEILIIAASRHYSAGMTNLIKYMKRKGIRLSVAIGDNQGFIDQFDDYHTREEALVIAKHAGQLEGKQKCSPSHELFSEDLY